MWSAQLCLKSCDSTFAVGFSLRVSSCLPCPLPRLAQLTCAFFFSVEEVESGRQLESPRSEYLVTDFFALDGLHALVGEVSAGLLDTGKKMTTSVLLGTGTFPCFTASVSCTLLRQVVASRLFCGLLYAAFRTQFPFTELAGHVLAEDPKIPIEEGTFSLPPQNVVLSLSPLRRAKLLPGGSGLGLGTWRDSRDKARL